MHELACLFVLYNPSRENIRGIREIMSYFPIQHIFDNTEVKNKNRNEFITSNYYSDGKNHGLAYAYNLGIEEAHRAGVKWLAIFDQDSRITEIDKLIEYLSVVSEDVVLVCPFIKYSESDPVPSIESQQVNWSINSGSFLNVQLIKSAGIMYDEYYFLDRLDADFCKQIIRKGYKIVRVNTCVMSQRLGERVGNKNTHSPQRNYYMARNRLYFNHKFFSVLPRIFLDVSQSLKHIIGILRAKVKVRENLRMMGKGISDYHNGIGGKIEF